MDGSGVIALVFLGLCALALPFILGERIVADLRRRGERERARRARFADERRRFEAARRAARRAALSELWRAGTTGDEMGGAR